MSRLPIRLRLTAAFALGMAVVFATTGSILYQRLGASLDEGIDEGLQARAAELTPAVAAGDPALRSGIRAGTIDADERFVQVLDSAGRVVVGSPHIGNKAVLPADVVARVRDRGSLELELDRVPGIAGRARLLAVPVDSVEGSPVLVVGSSLEDRDETTRGFLILLLLVGPIALVLVSALGYTLATAALRPVESMRVQAEAISASEPGRRLPLPASHDEISRLGETLNEMLDRLESAFERERSFVADASHELRTPLALLKTELELALRRPRTEAELRQALLAASADADRVVRLAEDLLVLARSDQGQLALRTESLTADDLLSGIATRHAPEAAAFGRTVEVEVGNGLAVRGDRAKLEQALDNLVENALRHGDGAVRLRAAEQDGYVELHVLDQGPGFSPAFLPLAFDRFSRADGARSGGGAGLGLAIVAAIARAHRGSAQAENRADGGADVWLSIPAAGA
jgi:two-component system OmpR family sensor kinase